MKKTYTKKQITEAIAYWKKQLDESSTDSGLEYEDRICDVLVDKCKIKYGENAYVMKVNDITEVKSLHKPAAFESELVRIKNNIVEKNNVNTADIVKFVLVIHTGFKRTLFDILVAIIENDKLTEHYFIECKKDIAFGNIWTPTFKLGIEDGKWKLVLNNKFLQQRAPSAYGRLNKYFNKIFRDKLCHSDVNEFSQMLYDFAHNNTGTVLKSDKITINKNFGKFLDEYFIQNENEYSQYNADYINIGTGIRQNGQTSGALIKLNKDADLIIPPAGKKLASSFEDVFKNGVSVQLRQRYRKNYIEIDCDIMVNILPEFYSLTDEL